MANPFSVEELETKARTLIINTYQRANIPLPDGYNDSDVLQSLAIAIVRNEHNFFTQPKLRQLISGLDPARKN